MKARIALFFLLLLALPLCGFSQSTLNFPRLFAVTDLDQTGFAIVNPSPTAAAIKFTLYSASGVEVDNSDALPVPLTIPARGQISKLGNELFKSPNLTAGWVQATSATTGLQGFWLGGDFKNLNFLDGAEGAPAGLEFIFPLATATTELNIANLSIGSNNITISVFGAAPANGLALVTTTQTIAEKGVYRTTLQGLFPTLNFSNAMYVKVTGTGDITGTTVAVDFIHAPSWSVINGISTSSTVTEANFPHVPSGPEDGSPKWTSVLGITNLSSVQQTITITYNRSRWPLNQAAPTIGIPASVTRTLAPNGAIRETVKDLFSFGNPDEDGWVKVTGTAPLGGFIAYGYNATNGVAVVPVQTTPQTSMIFSHVANGPGWGTGVALLNATSTDATVEVYIMRLTGALVGGAQSDLAASINLPAGAKISRLVNELVPTATANDGFVYVKSTNNVPLYAFELFFSSNLQVIANVAAGAVHPSITFTPPTPPVPLPPLTITSISPATVPRGNLLTISGTGFSTIPSSNSVVFSTATGSVPVTPTLPTTAGSITVPVPATAVSGPVYVATGGRFSTSAILQVTATATTTITSDVTVTQSQNTIADIYVAPAAGTTALNIIGTALTDTTVNSINSVGAASLEIARGQTKRLWIAGDGISAANGTTVTASGLGITFFPPQINNGSLFLSITVAPSAPTGPRNIIVTNSNLDTSVYTGGLIIR